MKYPLLLTMFLCSCTVTSTQAWFLFDTRCRLLSKEPILPFRSYTSKKEYLAHIDFITAFVDNNVHRMNTYLRHGLNLHAPIVATTTSNRMRMQYAQCLAALPYFTNLMHLDAHAFINCSLLEACLFAQLNTALNTHSLKVLDHPVVNHILSHVRHMNVHMTNQISILHYAIIRSQEYNPHDTRWVICYEYVKLLLEFGMNPNLQTASKMTPLHFIVSGAPETQESDAYLLQLLLSHHADCQLKNDDGYTPGDIARTLHNTWALAMLENQIQPCR